MSQSTAPRPFWRTKKGNRSHVEQPGSGASSTTNISTLSDNAPHNDQLNLQRISTQIKRKPVQTQSQIQTQAQSIHALIAELKQSVDSNNRHELPQSDGFIGLYVRILLYYSAVGANHSVEHLSPYSGRVGYHRSLEVVKIGEGASFSVFKRHDLGFALGRDSKLVVMKNSKVSFDNYGMPNDMEAIHSLIREINVLSHPGIRQHPNVVRLLDIRWDHPSLEQEQLGPTLYLEYASLGTLNDFRNAQRGEDGPADPPSPSIMLDICRGLEALHQCGITHGDIKPSNILLFADGSTITAKISDFGSAMFVKPDQSGKVVLPGISPIWDAPEAGSEILPGLLHKADIYSFGLLYWWYVLDSADPFGINSTAAGALGFTGDRNTKLDAFKVLKQNEDLGPRMYATVMNNQNSGNNSGGAFAREVSAVAHGTLLRDSSQRSLASVRAVLESSAGDRRPTLIRKSSAGGSAMDDEASHWEPQYAWDLPLISSPYRPEPAHRFLETLKSYTSMGSGSQQQRSSALVLIFRCYLEGYSTPQDFSLAAQALREAAQLGDTRSQATIAIFHRAIGFSGPPPRDLWRYLCSAGLITRNYHAMRDKCIHSNLFQFDPSAFDDLQRQPLLSHEGIAPDDESSLLLQLDVPGSNISWQAYGNMEGRFNASLLHQAAAQGWLQLIRSLFEKDVLTRCKGRINQLDNRGLTPLVYACHSGHPEIVLELLDNGATPDTKSKDTATSILNYLPDLHIDHTGHAMLFEVAQKMVRCGANPNAKPSGYGQLSNSLSGLSDPFIWSRMMAARAASPLIYALWLGDIEVVKCLFDTGALPDIVCLHVAAGLHNVELLDTLLAHRSLSFSNLGEFSLGGKTLLDTALDNSGVCSSHQRIVTTGLSPAQSTSRMVDFILHRMASSPGSSSLFNGAPMVRICRNVNLSASGLLPRLFGVLWMGGTNDRTVTEALDTAIVWNNPNVVDLLTSTYTLDATAQAKAINSCASYPVDPAICRKLVEQYRFGINFTYQNKMYTDLEIPIHVAIACQNFGTANYLFEKGAHREMVIPSPKGRLYDINLLGWLIQITWSESKHRLRYLFEEYSRSVTPDFIVMRHIGRSALQQVASYPPANKWSEQDVRDMMQYLVEKFPGSRHLEYQRIDNPGEVRGDQRAAGYIYAVVDGVNTVVDNEFHFKSPNKTYTPTKEKEHNGTALHHAVRAINLPAVEVLLEAGADVSAVIGLPLPDTMSFTRKPGSTYAVKENLWACTVLDFAVLTKDRLESGIYPSSMPDTTPATIAYFTRRINNIIDVITKRGGSQSVTFIGKRAEANIFKARREKGNLAALRMVLKDTKQGFSQGMKNGKTSWNENWKEYREEQARTNNKPADEVEFEAASALWRQGRSKEAAEIWEKLLQQQENALGSLSDYNTFTGQIRMNLALVYGDQGRNEEAESFGRRALQTLEDAAGEESKWTLLAAHNLAAFLSNSGRYQEAEPLCLRALNGRKKTLGPDDPETLSTVANLASVYSFLGRYNEANEAFERALVGQEKALGPEDRSVLATLSMLGAHYNRSGRKEDAKVTLQRAITGREKTLGSENQLTLDSVQALAAVLKDLGEVHAAATMYERAFQGFKNTFGTDHASTTSTAYQLALVYQDQGRLHDALSMFALTLQGQENRLGTDHDKTMCTVFKIACVYKEQEDHTEAERMFLRVLAFREAAKGLADDLVRDSHYNLGIMYHKLGRFSEAATSLESALKGEEIALGVDNTSTLYTVFELAKVYKKQERYSETEPLFIRAASGREKAFGAKDLAVRNSHFNLGDMYATLDRLGEAVKSFQLALAGEEEALGYRHSDTLLTVSRLANILKTLGRYEESERYFLRCVSGREKLLGSDDKVFLDTVYNMALMYKLVPNYASAESAFQKACQGYERTLGPNHEETLECMDKVGEVMEAAGRYKEALEVYHAALQRREESLGPGHDDTKTNLRKISNILDKLESKEKPPVPAPIAVTSPPSYEPAAAASSTQATPAPIPYQPHPELSPDITELVQALSIDLTMKQGGEKWDLQRLDPSFFPADDIDTRDSDGLTPLLWASKENHARIVFQALNYGADIQQKDKSGRTSLHLSAQHGHANLCKRLLENGALLTARDAKGNTPLHLAAEIDGLDAMKTLFEFVAHGKLNIEIEAENRDGYTALQLAAKKGCISTAKLLLESGASMSSASSKRGLTAAFMAAENGHVGMLELFIDKGLDLEQYSVIGMNALHYATSKGHREAIEFLLGRGANIEAQCASDDLTPLWQACIKYDEAIAQTLINRGANMYAVAANGLPLLHNLAKAGLAEPLRFLLENGVDIENRDITGSTPVQYAVQSTNTAALELLLECGADLTAKSECMNANALHYAAAPCGNARATELVIKFGAPLNELEMAGNTALHLAAGHGMEESVKLLMKAGADMTVKNNDGLTALQLAASRGQTATMTLLILGVQE